ncbi:glucose 1-dehydrogenase [Caldimonas brevitalea]|uniref:Short-chain dehydrogenase n=1 Tax=Caldimonas brevitalea TaxID=413882 RepID=A0A0G3BU36_9BURK|nr:glucose 1-dehydrogenase [Caldimonas brevitalea]AKJ31538.1 short-chain dehydrogenase [Caldimonas brevitalea]
MQTPVVLTGRVAMVTGAGGGIGREIARALAAAGATVVGLDLSEAALQASAASLREQGLALSTLQADVGDTASVAAAVARIVAEHGRLDIAVNNAGIEEEHTKLADVDEVLFDRILRVNVKGVWLCMKHQIQAMLKQGGGSIVNIASVAGLVGAPLQSVYAGSKHAVVGMTKSAAAEYARRGIRINSVCPGITRTAMLERALERAPQRAPAIERAQPMGRVGEPGEIAAAVLWLASDAASFVTGHQLAVDGGLTAV